jgi:hypothetical protein
MPDKDIIQALGLLIAPDSVELIFDFWNVPPLASDIRIFEKKENFTNIAIEYEVDISANCSKDFEKEWNNIAKFKVFDFDNNDISIKCQYVEFGLSIDAMLGLGTELIRLAHNFEEGKEVHILPASKEKGAEQSMGIFLTPDSCELIIKCENFGPIDKYLEEYKAKNLK